ncbi:hypothetical protein [Rossellomorea sp. LjRoot5]|uniref:hypothetical protein n=1 Tax=Rossellomorea sp. LjRoot5 TaxID=3342331 RepID=UPI003ED0BFF0
MRKKKKPTNGKAIDCKIDLPPRGCPGIFPFEGCTNPTIQLDDIGIISCEGIISGRVLCDYQPLQGVTVTLTSSFPGLVFEDMTPVTDSTGRFSTRVTVPPGTPITPNVRITATAVVIGKTISDTIFVRVDCILCKNPVLTLEPIPCPVGCKGTQIKGRLICDGQAIGNAAISFIIESASNRVVITPNPAITQSDGRYTATLVLFPDVDETIRITAVTKIGGLKVVSKTREVAVRCVKCKNPAIKLNKLKKIDCRSTISGKVTCDGVPQANVPVTLTGSSILMFQTPNPVTDENGRFSSVVTVKKGTPFQTASYTATAVIDGKTISATDTVIAGCKKCRNPKLTLEVPCETVTCEGTKLTGRLTCDGAPVKNARISFTVTATDPGAVEIDPNPAFTDEEGRYVTELCPRLGVHETIMIKASATAFGEQVVASGEITIDCRCKHPKIHIKENKKLNCKGIISGCLSCEGFPLTNKEVSFSSPVLTFKPQVVTTDENGEFSTLAFVPPNTPFREVPFTATAVVGGKAVSEMVFVYAGCLICEKPKLTLCVPDCVECEGAAITGKFTCNGRPVANAGIKLKVTPDVASITPDKIKTNAKGEYEAVLTPDSHVSGEAVVQAIALIDGKEIIVEEKIINIHCTCSHPKDDLDEMEPIDCWEESSGIRECDRGTPGDCEMLLPENLPEDKESRSNDVVSSNAETENIYEEEEKISDFKETAHPCLSLNVPVVVSCRGGCLTGKVQCEDMKQIEVYFEVLEEHLKSLIMPNPAIPDKDGNYAADITPKHGMTESITIRAFIFWKGKRIVSHPGCTILACSSKKMDDD